MRDMKAFRYGTMIRVGNGPQWSLNCWRAATARVRCPRSLSVAASSRGCVGPALRWDPVSHHPNENAPTEARACQP
jgi:hypothetical protein